MLKELHSTHLSSDGMKRLARGKFHWSGMGKEIEKCTMNVKAARRIAEANQTFLEKGMK